MEINTRTKHEQSKGITIIIQGLHTQSIGLNSFESANGSSKCCKDLDY